MPSLALCFQVHQPYRLRPFSYFESKTSSDFFNSALNQQVMQRVSERCYLPANAILQRALDTFGRDFSCAFSITGTAIEQMRQYSPKTLASFKCLAASTSVELLAETYYHSLASLQREDGEFLEQVRMHQELMHSEFGRKPKVFRNTELLYSDRISQLVHSMGFEGILIEAVDRYFEGKNRHRVYRAAGCNLRLLPRDYSVSDDVAFRFHFGSPGGKTLRAADMMQKLRESTHEDEVVFFYVDYETFGEHHHSADGVLAFLEELPGALLKTPGWRFITPGQALEQCAVVEELAIPTEVSWADTSRDASTWLGNKMQQRAFQDLCAIDLNGAVDQETWRKLQTSDHFYYMSTKGSADGVVHRYFSPFESPYDAFVTYMNVLRAVRANPIR
jgi:alpha-amylase